MVIFSVSSKRAKGKREREVFFSRKERKGKERKESDGFFLFVCFCRTFFPSFFF